MLWRQVADSLRRSYLSYSPARSLCRSFSSRPVRERIDELVKSKKVVVFMKGVPQQPQCGFSRAVCLILDTHGVKDFDAHDVLADEQLRQGIKEYSSWPTLPQVFFNGEFVGGCDIMMEMHKNGELVERLRELGITSRLATAADGSSSSSSTS